MRKILIGLLLLTLNISFAQRRSHVISIKPSLINDLKGFSINEIIDKRIVKSNIGFAQTGTAKHKVTAVLPNKFENYIKSIFDRMIPECKSCEALTIIVYEFNVSEQTKTMSELGTFRIQLEFAKRENDKLYSLAYVETQIEGKGMDVTKKHSKRIFEGMKYCLNVFNKSNWRNKQGDEISQQETFSFDYNAVPKKGLYASFSKMCKNEPFKETNYLIKYTIENKSQKYYILDEEGKKINNRIMFFSDGKNIFLNAFRFSYESYFVKSEQIGRYVYFKDKFSDPMAEIMFGLIKTTSLYSTKLILLDTVTGLVIKLRNDRDVINFLNEYPTVKKKYKKSRKRIINRENAIKTINAMFK